MLVRVSELENELTLKGGLPPGRLEGVDDSQCSLASPVAYEVTVSKYEDGVVKIRGSVSCELVLTCVRCLEEFSYPVAGEIDIELMPKEMMPSGTEIELKSADLETDYYEGDEIEIDDFVREEVLLGIPFRPLCAEACRGLCSVCGKNLNNDSCCCDRNSQTLLGEKLKSFFTE